MLPDRHPRPDFIVIGTMKSGTTTLFRWLQQSTGSVLSREKEPAFFSEDSVYQRGLDWYRSLFPESDAITGEASVAYTHPDHAAKAARRIAEALPDVKLIALLREPAARLRSHYRHELQRGREKRDFADAVGDPRSLYVRHSLYDVVLAPYLDTFGSSRILVTQSEALFGPEHEPWHRLQRFLSLPATARPDELYNVSERKAPYTQLMRRLFDSGLAQRIEPLTPTALKRLARPLLLKDHDPTYNLRTQDSRALPIPDEATSLLRHSRAETCRQLGLDLKIWEEALPNPHGQSL